MCVGEEVTGGDATDRLVDVHGCDLSGSPAKPRDYKVRPFDQHTGNMFQSAENDCH